jgi:phosphoenolpyruvate---glycerone phosphotransferase subunit DhaL
MALTGVAAMIDATAVKAWLSGFAEEVAVNRNLLTQLDAAIGDADHGINLDRGLTEVIAAFDGLADPSPGVLLKTTGMTLVRTVGGASGPLYGTFFLRMSAAAGDLKALDPALLADALRAGLDGVVARGRAQAGDKTMYDALAPACDALDASLADGLDLTTALQRAVAAADTGRDATIPMLARKGRASYLGERSVGHHDPGATSSAMLVSTLVRVLGKATTR